MAGSVAEQIIRSHLVTGEPAPGEEIGLRVDQTLTQDATGTLVMVGDNVSTDEISPAGAAALPYRSNIPKLAEFTFTRVDRDYPRRAAETGPHAVVAGDNYGQGSSREHALDPGHTLNLDGLDDLPPAGGDLTVLDTDTDHRFTVTHHLSDRQLRMIRAGGQIPLLRTETTS